MNSEWITPAEQSNFRTTPSYAQTHAYLERLAAAAPGTLRLTRFGVSPEGRDLMLVVAASDGEFTPRSGARIGQGDRAGAGRHPRRRNRRQGRGPDAAARSHRRQQACGICSIMRSSCTCRSSTSTATRIRMPYNRINQNGPEKMGFRATAQNLNLNRDYMKADAPEMRAWLAMFDAWLPDLFMDIHTTDGADYQYDLTWYLEDWGPLHPAVKALAGHRIQAVDPSRIRPHGTHAGAVSRTRRSSRHHQGYRQLRIGPALLDRLCRAAQSRGAAGRDAHAEVVRSARPRDVRSRDCDARVSECASGHVARRRDEGRLRHGRARASGFRRYRSFSRRPTNRKRLR